VERDPNFLVDVSAQLEHSDLMTTQHYYAQINAERADEPAGSNSVEELLRTLGIGSVEELKARLLPRAEDTENRGIDPKKRLPSNY
jgi:hypothetical protein